MKTMDLRDRIPNIMELKRQVGVKSYSKLHAILKGTKRPGPLLTLRIEAATNGAIQRWELRSDIWEPPTTQVPPPLAEAS